MTLGEQIQALRKGLGLSQEELGEKLGVARQSVSKWESGATVPELDKIIAMSKLFGVSVGSLLGIEETGESGHELTDRELKALEAIAKRLVPTVPEPRKRKRWPYVVAAVAVVVAGAVLMSRIHDLENQIGGLHYNISNIDNTVSRQISSLTGQVREILEEQNSVTAGKGYEVVDMDLQRGEVTFSLTATPREYREGMEAVFSATGADFAPVEVPGVLGAGQTFTGSLTCPLTDDITLAVGFTADGVTVSQELGQETYLFSQTQLTVDGDMNWSISGRGEEASFNDLRAFVNNVDMGWYKTREDGVVEIGLAGGELRLWKEDALVWSRELEKDDWKMEVAIPVEGLKLAPGEKLLLSLLYTDTAGRENETYLAGIRMDEDGVPEWLAPYVVDGSYPWD